MILWYTVKAIRRVEEIRTKRQNLFIKNRCGFLQSNTRQYKNPFLSLNRLKAGLKLTEEVTKEEVQQSIHLIQDSTGFI